MQPRLKMAAHRTILAFIACNGRWANKMKLHKIVHLCDAIRRFGPATNFATEKFESFNGVLRQKSIHSNRHNPSRDICRSFADTACFRHLVSGGWWKEPDDEPEVEGQTLSTYWQRAGESVRHLFEDADARRCIGLVSKPQECDSGGEMSDDDAGATLADLSTPFLSDFVMTLRSVI
jgi:hypothetical protein